MEEITLALAQMAFTPGDVDANIAKITHVCREAVAKGAHMVVFPETAVTGSLQSLEGAIGEGSPDGRGIGLRLPSSETEQMAELCRDLEVCLVAGTVEEVDQKLYNSAFVVTPAGYQGKFRKMFLPPEEQELFTPGDSTPVFDYLGWRFGVAVCYDIYFPELARIYALKGADIIIVPTGGAGLSAGQIDEQRWKPWFNLGGFMKVCPARALDNNLYVAMAVAADAGGGSVVVDSAGEQIAYGGAGELLLTVTIKRELLEAARARSAWPRSWTYLPDLSDVLFRELQNAWNQFTEDGQRPEKNSLLDEVYAKYSDQSKLYPRSP